MIRLRFRIVEVLDLVVRVLAGATLAIAGFEKTRAFAWWTGQVDLMQLLPSAYSAAVAAIVAGTELVVGTLLLLGLFVRPAILLSAWFYAVFAGALTILVSNGRADTCACFGPNSSYPIDARQIAYRVIAAVVLFLIYWRGENTISLDRLVFGQKSPA